MTSNTAALAALDDCMQTDTATRPANVRYATPAGYDLIAPNDLMGSSYATGAESYQVRISHQPQDSQGAWSRSTTRIEETHTEHLLQVRDRLRRHGMGNCEMIGCYGKAAMLHDREQDVQVPQLEEPGPV